MSRPKRTGSAAIRIFLRLRRSAITPAGCENRMKARMRSIRALPMTAVADAPPELIGEERQTNYRHAAAEQRDDLRAEQQLEIAIAPKR